MLRTWLAKKLVSRNLEALNKGDIGPTLRLESRDVHFRFPGNNSWGIETTGRAHVEAWLRRMVAVGLQHRMEDLVVGGPPWRMTMVLRGIDHVDAADGTSVYANRYVIWAKTRWGFIYDYEVYEDTEKATAFDARLEAGAAA